MTFFVSVFRKASGEDTFLFFLSVESQEKEEKFNYPLEKKGILVLPTFFRSLKGAKTRNGKERKRKNPPTVLALQQGVVPPSPLPLQFQNWPVEGTEEGSLAFLYYNSTWLGWWSEKIFLKTLFGGKKGAVPRCETREWRKRKRGERESFWNSFEGSRCGLFTGKTRLFNGFLFLLSLHENCLYLISQTAASAPLPQTRQENLGPCVPPTLLKNIHQRRHTFPQTI